MEGVELIEFVDSLLGGMSGGKVVLVVDHKVGIVEVFEGLEASFVLDADTIAGEDNGAVVTGDVLK